MKPWEKVIDEAKKWAGFTLVTQFIPSERTEARLQQLTIARMAQTIIELREQIIQMDRKQQHGCADFNCPLCDQVVEVGR